MPSPMTRAAVNVACEYFSINDPKALFLRTKRRRMVRPRRFAWAILKAHGWSYPAIAGHFQDPEGVEYDHTTIMHGVQRAHEEWGDLIFKQLAADAWMARSFRVAL
ncbi:MAG: helix-turn-helix domain-containing protein [Pseudomonadota bacterium]